MKWDKLITEPGVFGIQECSVWEVFSRLVASHKVYWNVAPERVRDLCMWSASLMDFLLRVGLLVSAA